MKKWAMEWKKILANYISGKGQIILLLRTLKIVRVRHKTIKIKDRQKIWTDTWPKKIYLWQVSPWKDVQHHYSIEKKLKPQWGAVRMAKIKKIDLIKYWQWSRGAGNFINWLWEFKMIQLFWEYIPMMEFSHSKKNESIHLYKELCSYFHNHYICNIPN